eukprot:1532693-Alexandrium_andersonii.AAC.1
MTLAARKRAQLAAIAHPTRAELAHSTALRGLLPGLQGPDGLLLGPLVAGKISDGPNLEQESWLALGTRVSTRYATSPAWSPA